jgi:hypothetical protein
VAWGFLKALGRGAYNRVPAVARQRLLTPYLRDRLDSAFAPTSGDIVPAVDSGLSGLLPSTPEAAEILETAEPDGRTKVSDNRVYIVGQHFGGEEETSHSAKIVGAVIAPVQKPPNVYAPSVENYHDAIHNRLDAKSLPFQPLPSDIRRMGVMISESMHSKHANRRIFGKERILAELEELCGLEDAKSRKWSWTRFASAWERTHEQYKPDFEAKGQVKLEAMPEGKAPRALIADGDQGQLMSLLVVYLFEKLLFTHLDAKCVKHLSKRAAMEKAAANLRSPNTELIETDGSAWDTCMSAKLRALLEDPILKHIADVVNKSNIIPKDWNDAHERANTRRRAKIKYEVKEPEGKDMVTFDVASIRRSGHRGTSCLNFWCNFCLFHNAISAEPEKYLAPTTKRTLGHDGKTVWVAWSGEGDDGAGAVKPKMSGTRRQTFLKVWERFGVNMKIINPTTRMEFCGYHFSVNPDGSVGDVVCPDIPRCLTGAGVSTSVTARGTYASKTGERDYRELAACSAYARAAELAPVAPTLARKFFDFADTCHPGNHSYDRESSMRVFGEEGHHSGVLREYILQELCTPEEERANLAALGWTVSNDEMQILDMHLWSLEPSQLLDYDGFRRSLPVCWRA